MNPLRYLLALFILLSFNAGALAQSPYKGFYTGLLYIEISGAINIPESPVGPVFLTIDENGYIFGNLEGYVDGSGAIAWSSNDLGFTTGQIDGSGQMTSEVSINTNPTVSTYRLRAQNQAGGFGQDALSIAHKFQWVSPLPVNGELNDIAYGDGVFVAVGEGGAAAFSGDGETWFSLSIPAGVDLNGVAYGNSVWVVAGDSDTAFVSEDLETWTPVVIGGGNCHDLTFGNGKFYAATLTAGIQTSINGASWTSAYAPTSEAIMTIDFLNGLFIAQSDPLFSASGKMLLSTNGAAWNSVTLANGVAGKAAYGNGKWVFPLTRKFYRFTQTNGGDLASVDTSYNTNAMGFIGGKFMDGDYYVSSDAVSWSQLGGLPFTASNFEMNAYASNGTTLVGVGEGVISTTDAATVAQRSSRPVNTTLRLFNIVQGGGHWLITGDNVTSVSDDLATWTTTPLTGNQFENVAFGAGVFIATGPGPGAQPIVYRSTDGVNWEQIGATGQFAFPGHRLWRHPLGSGLQQRLAILSLSRRH